MRTYMPTMLTKDNVLYHNYGLKYTKIIFWMDLKMQFEKSWPPGRFVCHPILCNGKCISSVYVRTSSILWHLHTFTVAFTLFYRIEGFIRDNGPYHILYPLNLRSVLHQMKNFVCQQRLCAYIYLCTTSKYLSYWKVQVTRNVEMIQKKT